MKKGFMVLVIFLGVIILSYLFFGDSLAGFDTVYTKDFSYSRLNMIKIDMSKEEVKNILGEPFVVWKPGNECWVYSKPKEGYFFEAISDFLMYINARVCFDKNAHVSWAGSNTF